MIRVLLLISACLAASGCGPGECAAPNGRYAFKLVSRSGDCGAMVETIVTIDEGRSSTTTSSDCTRSGGWAADMCSFSTDLTCPIAGTKDTRTIRGQINWSQDGTRGSGVLELIIKSAISANACQGTYNATYTRL